MNKLNFSTPALILIFLLFILTTPQPTLPQGIHSMHVADFQHSLPNVSQQIMAYYDFNSDQYCDALTIATLYSPDEKTIKSRFFVLYLWNEKSQTFVRTADMNLSFMSVVSVIATRFYHREQRETDLVVTYHYVAGNDNQAEVVGKKFAVDMIKLFCDKSTNECSFQKSFSTVPQLKMFDPILPSLILLEGRPSLIFRKNNQTFALYFVLQQTGEPKYQIFSLLKSGKYLSIQKNNTEISSTLAYELSYFGDYNGDGVADLLVSEKTIDQQNVTHNKIQFFKYDKVLQKFVLEKTFDLKLIEQSLSTWLQFFTLQDINFDGKIDLILLFKSGLIQIHYNKIPNSQIDLIEENGYEIFPFDLYEIAENYVSKIQRIKLPTFTPISSSGLLFGDFNLDGYDDLIVDYQYDVQTGQMNEDGQPVMKTAEKSLLLINTPCTTTTDCGDGTFNQRFIKTLDLFTIRKFSILDTLPTTYKTNESFKMFFIDLYKDGQLDLIIHRLSSNISFYTWDHQSVKSRQIQIYYNNVHYDAFFMKVRVMRGVSYDQVHDNLIVPGGNVNCFVTSLGGEMLPKVGNQYSQVGRVMHLPYVFFGLGRTNNYVNQLTVTIPYISPVLTYQYMWTPIIPNSQIVTLANPEGAWQLAAFIEPTKKMGLVTFLVVVSLIVLGVVICRLTAQEKNQDKENLENFYSIL